MWKKVLMGGLIALAISSVQAETTFKGVRSEFEQYGQSGENQQAKDLLKKVLAEDTTLDKFAKANLLAQMTLFELRLGDIDAAEAALAESKSIEKGNGNVIFNQFFVQALIYVAQKNYEEADKILQMMAKRWSDEYLVSGIDYCNAELLAAQGKKDEAVELYNKSNASKRKHWLCRDIKLRIAAISVE